MVDWYLLGDAALTIGGGTTFASTSWMRANAAAEYHAVSAYRGCPPRSFAPKEPTFQRDHNEPALRMPAPGSTVAAITEDMGF